MDTVKFGIIGCGRIARYHIDAIQQCEYAELAAVCDLKEELAKDLASKYGCKFFLDMDDMLTNEDIDVVIICTHNSSHKNLSIKIAGYKKHILTEKPMALTTNDCDEMIEVCRNNGVNLFVVKQNRYNAPIMELRKAMEKGRFGKLVLGNVTVRWSRSQDYYDKNEWHGSRDVDGGMLFTQASHFIDMLQWFMGPVKSVTSNLATLTHNIETEDTAVAILEFKNGAVGVLEATTCTYPKDTEGSITIIGEKGTAKVGGIAMNKMEHWVFSDIRPEDENIRNIFTDPPNVYGFGHGPLIENVAKYLLFGKKDNVIFGEEGKNSVEVIEAIIKSSETGEKVYLN